MTDGRGKVEGGRGGEGGRMVRDQAGRRGGGDRGGESPMGGVKGEE